MGELFLVPTPIGNLGDITHRAVAKLKQVDMILAEDTRTSRKLLNHYHISFPEDWVFKIDFWNVYST